MKSASKLWDLFSALSLIGIWPRFIEPNLLEKKFYEIPLESPPSGLSGLKIAHFSDLHISPETNKAALNRLSCAIMKEAPELIVFSGDFLTFSKLYNKALLLDFLHSLSAPLGCFACLGNHDYNQFIAVDEKGYYNTKLKRKSPLFEGIKRLFIKPKILGAFSKDMGAVQAHSELLEALKETPFQLLQNTSQLIERNGSPFYLVGLGEYMAGDSDPSKAFSNIPENAPSILLSHNPDSLKLLEDRFFHLVLMGHTHGGQINLPFLRDRLIIMENPTYREGLFRLKRGFAYVSKGFSGAFSFRLFAKPEVTFFTLR